MGRHRNAAGAGPLATEPKDAMLQLTRTITSAEFKNLAGTVFVFLGPPGAGRTIVVLNMIAHIGGTVAYTAGSALTVYIGVKANGNSIGSIPAGRINNAAGQMVSAPADPAVNWLEDTDANLQNQHLEISVAGADFTTGDGDVDLTLNYVVAP